MAAYQPAGASTADRDGPGERPRVGIQLIGTGLLLAEGESRTVRLECPDRHGELRIRLELGGSAVPGDDFVVEGGEAADGVISVPLPAEGGALDLVLRGVDDVPAEPDEHLTIAVAAGDGYRADPARSRVALTIPRNDFAVTTTADNGEGSLRQAILNALSLEGGEPITFDPIAGPFATPQTIVLERELPRLEGSLVLNGRIPDSLWKEHGVTISGGGRRRLFEIAPGADVTLSALTLGGGRARRGGAILNRGRLVLRDCTLVGNRASRQGGAVFNLGGALHVVNSTLVDNQADAGGGAVASRGRGSRLTVTHATFGANGARRGGAIVASGRLLLRNSILADSRGAGDCFSRGVVDPDSTHNLIERDDGCGAIVTRADPRLERLGAYNGPTATIPLGGGSPAVNLGDNRASLDENGEPLRWDQRGNGDPRFVAGYADLGAFERQAFPDLTVDTIEDSGLRGCTPAGPPDCSLRGAIELANATAGPDTITFDARRLPPRAVFRLSRPLPEIISDLTLDAGALRGVTVVGSGAGPLLRTSPTASLQLLGIEVATPSPGPPDG